MKKTRQLTVILTAILFVFFGFSTNASINESFTFQGKITDDDGTNLLNADASCVVGGADTCDFRVRLYDNTTGGNLLWEETKQNIEIGDNDGIFNLTLDCSGTFSNCYQGAYTDTIFSDGTDIYIQIEFDPDGDNDYAEAETFSPRREMSSVPYAFHAKTADDAGTLDSVDSTSFLRSDTSDTFDSGGTLTFAGDLDSNGQVSIADTDIALDGATTNLTATGDFSVNTNNLFIEKSTGEVGINTSSPNHTLDINGDIGIQGGEIYLTGITSSSSTTEGTMYYDNDDDNLYVYANGGWVDLTTQGGGSLWTDGTNGHYNNTEGIIVGPDTAETLSNTGFSLNAGDLFVSDQLGVEGNIYTDGEFISGASLHLSDNHILDTNGDINIQADNDTDDYLRLDTTSDLPTVYWEGVSTYTNDPGVGIDASGNLVYRDQDESSWTTFDSLADSQFNNGGDTAGGSRSLGNNDDYSLAFETNGVSRLFIDDGEETADTDTKLLIHSNTTDGSTTFTDSSASNHTITVTGDTHHETDQKKFGTSSMEFDGTGDYLSVADSDNWNFGSGDFTIDLWVNLTSNVLNTFAVQRGTSSDYSFYFGHGSGNLLFGYSTGGGSWSWIERAWTPSLGTWYHVAVARDGTDVLLFVDGQQLGSTTGIGSVILHDSGRTLKTGVNNDNSPDYSDMFVDELRISKGIARWTSNFTPPGTSYSNMSGGGTGGNVGINNDSPNARLDVLFDGEDVTANDTKGFTVNTTGSTFDTTSSSLTNYSAYLTNTSTESAGTNDLTNIGLYVSASGADNNYAAIFENGNVGIGTTSPNHLLDVNGNIGLASDSYLNWGTTDGSTGYGFRDNSGTMEYKNSAGSWVAFGGGSGGDFSDGGDVAGAGRTLGNNDNYELSFETNGVNRLFISDDTGEPSLLIHSDGTDETTTFTDSSVNSHIITAYNDVNHETDQKKFGATSMQFDGAGDYMTIPTDSSLEFGTGDFTIDYWVRFDDLSSNKSLISLGEGASGGSLYTAWAMFWYTSNTISFYRYDGGEYHYTFAWTPVIDTWYHVAATRDGNNLRVFIDGTQVGSTTDVTGRTYAAVNSDPLYIGKWNNTNDFDGYLDEIRVTKGTALWNSNFTVPAAPGSSVAGAVGVGTTTARYLFDVDGDMGATGSVYANGSFIAGSTLTLNDGYIRDTENINLQPDNDTDDYLYLDTTSDLSTIYWEGQETNDPGIGVNVNGNLVYRDDDESGWTTFDSLSGVVGNGDFSNGGDTAEGSRSLGNNDDYTLAFETNGVNRIFIDNGGETTDTEISLLIHSNDTDESTTFDDSSNSDHTLTANGNVNHETDQKKFGASSIQFDGTGDYLTTPASSEFEFGTGDFTVDFWARFDDVSVFRPLISLGNGGHVSAPAYCGWSVIWTGSLQFYRFDGTETIRSVAWTPTIDTWYHMTFVRNGNDLKFYIDGTQVGSTFDVTGVSYNAVNSDPLSIGKFFNGATHYHDGFIDEVRIVKGSAKWTSEFTSPVVSYDGKISVADAGRVGINTTSPNAQLDVLLNGLDITTDDLKSFSANTTSSTFDTTSSSLTNYSAYLTNTSTESAGTNDLTNIGLYASASGGDNNYAAIFENGNVGIGTTTPTNGGLVVADGVTIGTDATDNLIDNATNGSASSTLYIGNETIDTSVSDERVKENIIPTNRGLSDILSLNIVDFTFKESHSNDTETINTGLIAQEVFRQLPYLAKQPENESTGLWSVKYNYLSALAIRGIQEQQEMINNIENNYNTLTTSLTDTTTSNTEKFTIIGTTVDQLTEQQETTTESLTTLTTTIENLNDLTTLMTDTLTNHEERIQSLETQISNLAGGEVVTTPTNLTTELQTLADNLTTELITTTEVDPDTGEETTTETYIFDVEGNLRVGEIEVSGIVTDAEVSGKAVVVAGETEMTINSSAITEDSKIYITLTSFDHGRSLYVDEARISEGESFVVKFNGDVLEEDVTFNWIIVK